MSYTPKHAKPSSLKDATMSSHHGAFGITDAASGRHARTHGKARRETDTDSASARRSAMRA
jgi:hypothetical protein